MDDQAQGIVDQPVTEAEMAAIDQAASQFGAVVQPMSAAPVDPTPVPIDPPPVDNTPGIVQASSGTFEQTDNPATSEIDEKAFLDPNATGTTLDGVADEAKLNTPSRVSVSPITPPTPPIDLAALLADEETPTPTPDITSVPDPDPTPEPIVEQGATSPEQVPTPTPVAEVTTPDHTLNQTLSVPPMTQSGVGNDEELLNVKQQALEQLTPIVDTIELPAEERFDTLMMIIRASDDKKLIKPAYEAANQIADPDKKARALLDVVNEVNYLTQLQVNQE